MFLPFFPSVARERERKKSFFFNFFPRLFSRFFFVVGRELFFQPIINALDLSPSAMPVSISPLEGKKDALVPEAVDDVVVQGGGGGGAEAAAIDNDAFGTLTTTTTTPIAAAAASAPPPPPSSPPPSPPPPASDTRRAASLTTTTASLLPPPSASDTRRASSLTTTTSLPPPPAALAAAAAAAASEAAAFASSSTRPNAPFPPSSAVSAFEHTHLATYLVLSFAVACVMNDSTQVGLEKEGIERREKKPRPFFATRTRSKEKNKNSTTTFSTSSTTFSLSPLPQSAIRNPTNNQQGILQKYELNRKWYLLYGECQGIGKERKREEREGKKKVIPFSFLSPFFPFGPLQLSQQFRRTHDRLPARFGLCLHPPAHP